MNEVMTDAQQKLVEDNLKLVHHVIWNYYSSFKYDEDIESCATLGLCKAALTWDESKAKFTTYACSCIRNEIRTELKLRQRRIETVSFDTPIDDNLTIGDTLAELEEPPKIIDYTFLNTLTNEEKVVFRLRAQGYKVEEIEEVTGYNHRKVLRNMRSAKNKYRRCN